MARVQCGVSSGSVLECYLPGAISTSRQEDRRLQERLGNGQQGPHKGHHCRRVLRVTGREAVFASVLVFAFESLAERPCTGVLVSPCESPLEGGEKKDDDDGEGGEKNDDEGAWPCPRIWEGEEDFNLAWISCHTLLPPPLLSSLYPLQSRHRQRTVRSILKWHTNCYRTNRGPQVRNP